MDFAHLSETLQRGAVTIVFINVLLKQLGLPVPAVPTLLLAGSLAAGPGQLGKIFTAAVVASIAADWVWYRAGSLFGYRLLAGLCKLSINPASCVSQTEATFVRWGISSLVVAKFIPGFSTVAPPVAGALRMQQAGFLVAAGIGAALWAGLPLAAGWILRDTVEAIVAQLDQHAGSAVLLALILLGFWLGWKLWQKYKFRKLGAIPHISPAELVRALSTEEPPLVLDLRGAAMIRETGPIAGARVAQQRNLQAVVGDWPKHRLIVTVCACPQDAGAIEAAQSLLNEGYLAVRPLRGGYDAWAAATGASERLIAGDGQTR